MFGEKDRNKLNQLLLEIETIKRELEEIKKTLKYNEINLPKK